MAPSTAGMMPASQAIRRTVSGASSSPVSVVPAPVPQDTPAEPAAQVPAAAAPGMSSTDKIAAIKGLGELKDQGLLTEQEFAAEKAKVLAG